MNKTILFLLLIHCHVICWSQNLAPNPSFENYSICPNNMGQIDRAFPWYHEELNVSNGDYYNRCNGDFSGVIQNYQTPRTGDGMTGFVFFTHPNATFEYREYIKVKLNKTLEPNISYCVTYYVSLLGLSWRATDALCACLSEDSLLCHDPNIMLLSCPNFVSNAVGNIIKDTLNWTKVTMSYTAHGGEQFLTLGNFKTSAQSNSEIVAPDVGWYSYYFIDDAAVYECNTPEHPANTGGNKCIEPGYTITLGSVQRAEYMYWWYDMQGNLLDTMATLTVSPTQTTSYILVQKDFKFDETSDTVTISVGNCPIDYSGVGFEIYPNPCDDIVKVRFNSIVPEGSVMQIYDMIGRKVAEYPLKGAENIATVNLFELATAIYHVTVVVPDGFRKSVKLVVMH